MRNVDALRGSSDTVATKPPSGPTSAGCETQPPSVRASVTDAGGDSPPGPVTNRPTTCGVRSDDTAGYWSHTLRPLVGAVLGARPSRPAVAAYSAAPCATSVIGSSPSVSTASS